MFSDAEAGEGCADWTAAWSEFVGAGPAVCAAVVASFDACVDVGCAERAWADWALAASSAEPVAILPVLLACVVDGASLAAVASAVSAAADASSLADVSLPAAAVAVASFPRALVWSPTVRLAEGPFTVAGAMFSETLVVMAAATGCAGSAAACVWPTVVGVAIAAPPVVDGPAGALVAVTLLSLVSSPLAAFGALTLFDDVFGAEAGWSICWSAAGSLFAVAAASLLFVVAAAGTGAGLFWPLVAVVFGVTFCVVFAAA